MLTLSEELRAAVKNAGNKPVRLIDPDTNAEFLLIPAVRKEDLDGSRLTKEEQIQLLIHAGLRAGWDDPAMDIYNDIEPDQL